MLLQRYHFAENNSRTADPCKAKQPMFSVLLVIYCNLNHLNKEALSFSLFFGRAVVVFFK